MTVIWRCDRAGKHYEVRRAGASLRLYTNGAFHSQYNPRHVFSGAYWDLLTLPVLFAQREPRTVLVLGVGGGTAILQLNRLAPPQAITAVEQDPMHIDVARRLFGADAPNVRFIEADASRWLNGQRRRYDVIVDDVFVDARADPVRPWPVDAAWLRRLIEHTGSRGVLIQNHLSVAGVRRLLRDHAELLQRHFETALLFTTRHYENGILALYRCRLDPSSAQTSALARIRARDAGAARRLRFDCRQLFQASA